MEASAAAAIQHRVKGCAAMTGATAKEATVVVVMMVVMVMMMMMMSVSRPLCRLMRRRQRFSAAKSATRSRRLTTSPHPQRSRPKMQTLTSITPSLPPALAFLAHHRFKEGGGGAREEKEREND